MTIYDLKPAFQALLRPSCRMLVRAGITANQVTIAAMLMSIVIGVIFALNTTQGWAGLLIPVWLFLRMALNAIDGMMAREHGMQSPLGGFLNELTDVISDAALYLPFALVTAISAELIVFVVFASLLVEMTGVVAVQVGASRRYDGPLGKSDRAFVFGLLGLLVGLGVPLAPWVNPVLGAVGALAVWTIVNRIRSALRELS
ncbi:MAG: CDP-alcohol phosphatidyltransferase family protein [Woeseiaceae bacterium]|nr:CDP-alcohol phosphatidyltransferase family protein [Woeseiaceae bacterium]